MIAKEKNPGLDTFNSPKPRAALPGYFGIRSEFDPRFNNFLNWWAEWNNKLGHRQRRMKEAMLKYSGITEIPESVTFTEKEPLWQGELGRDRILEEIGRDFRQCYSIRGSSFRLADSRVGGNFSPFSY